MSSASSPVLLAPRKVAADPDVIPAVGVEPGGSLIWTNNSKTFPTFSIEFVGANPDNPADATGENQVTVHFPTAGTFEYQIRHIRANGGPDKVSGTFSVRSCNGC
jgi:plastocyanin